MTTRSMTDERAKTDRVEWEWKAGQRVEVVFYGLGQEELDRGHIYGMVVGVAPRNFTVRYTDSCGEMEKKVSRSKVRPSGPHAIVYPLADDCAS